jgi:thioredoxin-related protein/YHS domain-containing protein
MSRLRIFGLILLLASSAPRASAQGVRWRSDLESAKREAAQTGRLVLLHFGATWCQPCKELEQTVLSQPQVAQAIEQHFVPLKLDLDKSRPIAQQYQVVSIPADVVITPAGQLIGRGTGKLPTAKYIERLNGIAASAGRSVPGAQPGPARSLAAVGESIPARGPQPAGPPGGMAQQPRPQVALPNAGQPPGDWQIPPSPMAPHVGNQYQGGVPGASPPVQPGAPPYGPGTSDFALPAMPQLPGDRPKSPPPYDPYGGNGGNPAAPPQNPMPPQRPGLPPLGFDGHCVVSMHQNMAWVKGDPRWGAIHEGRLYLFASPEAQAAFLKDPLRYAPVLSGDDVVLFFEVGQRVPGQRRFGASFQSPGENGPRIYLFANEGTLQKFEQNPVPYVERLRQAQQRPIGQAPWR